MAFILEGKEMYSIFVLAKCCWSFDSKVIRLGKNAQQTEKNAQQTEKSHSHTNFAVSRRVYVHALLVHHQYQGCQTRFSSGANSGKFNLKRAGPM